MNNKKQLLIEKRNSELFLRPRFSFLLEKNHQQLLNGFSEVLKSDKNTFRGSVVDNHVFISVSKKDEHFWSPQLHLEILESKDNSTELKGLFGPKPQVWTLFMFVHFIIAITFLGFCVLLYTKMSLKEPLVFPLIMIVVLPLIWILLYFLGKIGKNTGKLQMKKLHDFMIVNI